MGITNTSNTKSHTDRKKLCRDFRIEQLCAVGYNFSENRGHSDGIDKLEDVHLPTLKKLIQKAYKDPRA